MGVISWTRTVAPSFAGKASTSLASGGNTSGTVLNLAARYQDAEWLMVYLGEKAAFSIDRSKLTRGRQASAYWIDPRSGKSESIGELPKSGVQQFTTPVDWEDALLILE
jgi:Putative collagen-binding domain of a collagenase